MHTYTSTVHAVVEKHESMPAIENKFQLTTTRTRETTLFRYVTFVNFECMSW